MDIIKLTCGILAEIEAFNVEKSFDNYLVGSPLSVKKLSDIDGIKTPVSWGKQKIVLRNDKLDFSVDSFPNYIVMVWLKSEAIGAKKQQFDGSQIVVAFTVNSLKKINIEELIQSKLEDFEYVKYAENFKY